MEITPTSIAGVLLIKPDVFEDARGYFMETFHAGRYQKAGIETVFVQDNLSFSTRGTLRGLHFQKTRPQAKLVQVLEGDVYDVAVDLRPGSATFGRWVAEHLSGKSRCQLFIPEGFAHGFCVLSESALFVYKCSDFYSPEDEGGIIWSDPDLHIRWPVADPIVSEKDAGFARLCDLPPEALPRPGKQA